MIINNPYSTFSKATSITHETLEQELPDVYAATQALRATFKHMHDNNFDEEALVMANALHSFAFSKATQNSALGSVAQHIYGGLFGYAGNTPGEGMGNPLLGNGPNSNGVNPQTNGIYTDHPGWFSSVVQNPDNNRP
jgi:hypothetical protein